MAGLTRCGEGRDVAPNRENKSRVIIKLVIQPGAPNLNAGDETGLGARKIIRQNFRLDARSVHIKSSNGIGRLLVFYGVGCRATRGGVGRSQHKGKIQRLGAYRRVRWRRRGRPWSAD